MFIPTTAAEVKARGWDDLDIILVSGDTYLDSSYNGAAVIGHWLIAGGFRVGIICQPDVRSAEDITRLGLPKLFWSVTAGCVDSMVANYTATGKFRKDDDFTPGAVNDRRPDRACIAYANLIRRFAKGRPVVLGGILGLEFMVDRSQVSKWLTYGLYALLLCVPIALGVRLLERNGYHG